MEECQSYEEMCISGLLSIVHEIAYKEQPDKVERAVLVGSVGPQLTRKGYMDWEHMMVTPSQNKIGSGYGRVQSIGQIPSLLEAWAEFYGIEYFPTFDQVAKHDHGDPVFEIPQTKQEYLKCGNDKYLNITALWVAKFKRYDV